MRTWKVIFVLVLLFFGFLTAAFVKEARQGGKENLGAPEETPIEKCVEGFFQILTLSSPLYAEETPSLPTDSPEGETGYDAVSENRA